MYHLIQKAPLKLLVPTLLLLGLAPFFLSGNAFAASKGTCVLTSNQGQKTAEVKSCKSFFPSGKDANGKKVDSSQCYELYEQQGSVYIRSSINCSSSELTKKPTCPDGTLAPNGKPSECSGSHGNNPVDSNGYGGNCATVSKCDLFKKYINPLVKFMAALVGIAVVISIIVGGIQYASSADDPQKVSAAKNRIRNALIALVAFIFLYALLNFLIPGGLH